jgi:hypothetical protein
MPISIEEYREPSWIRSRERYTIAGLTDQKARFMNFEQYPRSYRGGVFKQPGYNVNHQAIRVERINMRSDDITLKPR